MAARLWWTVNALQSVFESSELVRGLRPWNVSVCLACFICRNSALGWKIPFKCRRIPFMCPQSSRYSPQPPDVYQIMLWPTFTSPCLVISVRDHLRETERERKGQKLGAAAWWRRVTNMGLIDQTGLVWFQIPGTTWAKLFLSGWISFLWSQVIQSAAAAVIVLVCLVEGGRVDVVKSPSRGAAVPPLH